MMSSGTKRKVEELGGHVISAAVGGVIDRAMSAAVGRLEAQASVDDQLERLRTLSIMLHSAVEAAEGVHIRSWWLRRWLWSLRDAALDADEVLQLFRQRRREAEETGAAGRQQATGNRNMVWRALGRLVKTMLLISRGNGGGGGGVERLSRMVARLEREAMGLGDFLKMLQLEIRRSPPVEVEPLPKAAKSGPPPVTVRPRVHAFRRWLVATASAAGCKDDEDIDATDDDSLSSTSHEEEEEEEYVVAGVRVRRKMAGGLVTTLRRRIRRALNWLLLMTKPPAAPIASPALVPPDTERVRELAARIRRAIPAAGAVDDFYGGEQRWLARWSKQLMAVAGRAEHLLLAVVPVQVQARGGGDGDGADVTTMVAGHDVSDDGLMMRTARDVEMAAAHLDDFVMLAGLRSCLSE